MPERDRVVPGGAPLRARDRGLRDRPERRGDAGRAPRSSGRPQALRPVAIRRARPTVSVRVLGIAALVTAACMPARYRVELPPGTRDSTGRQGTETSAGARAD